MREAKWVYEEFNTRLLSFDVKFSRTLKGL
jgi:hypothetical protein